ncbi:MAG: hypothetical protein QW279_04455 [Candidatus Jordarchaeaceae archaeon]
MSQNNEKEGENRSERSAKIANGKIVGIAFLVLLAIAGILAILDPFSIGKLCILGFWIGGLLTVYGYYHLVYVLPTLGKDIETRISMEALRASFWLVVFGLVVIILSLVFGFSLLMGELLLLG